MAIDQSNLKPAVVYWPAVSESTLGKLPSLRIEVPPTMSGRLDIYRVPISDANPEGYWANMCTGSYFETVEPGCAAWEKTLLAQIRFSGVPTGDSEGMGNALNAVEYLHPEIPLNDSQLNPNDYASMLASDSEA